MQLVKNLAKVYAINEIKTKNNNDVVAKGYGKSIYWSEVRNMRLVILEILDKA